MRHRKHRSKLNRTSEHRRALMQNLTAALVSEGRIRTTHVKAMQLRSFAEPLVTLARRGDLHARRQVFSQLGKKTVVHRLFEEIAPAVGDRDGGYLRIVKDGPRAGDGALMAYIEFVDEVTAGPSPEAPLDTKKALKKKMHERRKAAKKAR